MWLFSPDFAEPLTMPGYGGATSAGASVFGATGLDNQPPEEIIAIITSMGFHRHQAIQALRATVSTRDCVVDPLLLLEWFVFHQQQWRLFNVLWSFWVTFVSLGTPPWMAHRDLFAHSIYKTLINEWGYHTESLKLGRQLKIRRQYSWGKMTKLKETPHHLNVINRVRDLTWNLLMALEQRGVHEISCSIRQFFRKNYAFLIPWPWRSVPRSPPGEDWMFPWNSLLLFLSAVREGSGIPELYDTGRREGTVKLEFRQKSSFCSADNCLILRERTGFFF